MDSGGSAKQSAVQTFPLLYAEYRAHCLNVTLPVFSTLRPHPVRKTLLCVLSVRTVRTVLIVLLSVLGTSEQVQYCSFFNNVEAVFLDVRPPSTAHLTSDDTESPYICGLTPQVDVDAALAHPFPSGYFSLCRCLQHYLAVMMWTRPFQRCLPL